MGGAQRHSRQDTRWDCHDLMHTQVDIDPAGLDSSQHFGLVHPANHVFSQGGKGGNFADPRADHNLVPGKSGGTIFGFVISYHPAEAVFPRLLGVPATGGRVGTSGTECPAEVLQVINVTLRIDFVLGHSVVKVKIRCHFQPNSGIMKQRNRARRSPLAYHGVEVRRGPGPSHCRNLYPSAAVFNRHQK